MIIKKIKCYNKINFIKIYIEIIKYISINNFVIRFCNIIII